MVTLDFIEEKYSEALKKLDKILEIAENNSKRAIIGEIDISQIYEDIANCKVGLNDLKGAAEYYNKAVSEDDSKYMAHFNLGNVLFQADDIKGALKEFESVLELKKDFGTAKKNLLICKSALKQREVV